MSNITDIELTRALERGEIPNNGFHHCSHLHVAWVYLSESSSTSEAARKMSKTLRTVAVAGGHPEKYHETITLFWIYFLAHARVAENGLRLEELVHRHPRLLEKDFPLVYYSREHLFSEQARKCWIEPNLKPLSFDGVTFCSSSSSGDPPDRPFS
jgi:hypothetical protein